MRAGEETWLSAADGLDTFLLSGKRVGFVGFGNIGRRLRDLLEPFGCEVLRVRPVADRRLPRRGRGRADAARRAARGSRVIFVLATPTSENQALLSRALLELVAPDAVLVLVSRAHVVDFEALTELVLAGRFRAAIDVYPDEPFDRRAPDPDGARRRALAASGGPRPGGALGARANGRRRSGGDRTRAAAEAHAGGRARARDPVRPHHCRGWCSAATMSALADDALAVLRGERHRALRQAVAAALPWQWNWDSAFVAIGLARVDPERGRGGAFVARGAVGRRDGAAHRLPSAAGRLLARGRRSGARGTATERPRSPTSGLTQPPVLATAVRVLHEADSRHGVPRRGGAEARGVARMVPPRARASGRA